jgi:LacI family transcriptional regulator
MLKRTSLKDIARIVGVSTALVSYVLNNQKQGRISKEIAQKIRDTAAFLHYRPNQIARSLKTSKTYTIGLIVADISNPFSSSLARIIEDEADRQGYTVIFGSSDENDQKFEKLVEALLNRQVDGLIISPPAGAESQINQLKKQEVSFVLVDRYYPGIDTNWISLDNYSSTYDAVQHLLASGSKTVGMITYDTPLFHLQERKRGWLDAIKKDEALPLENRIREVHINNDQKEIENAVQDLLSLNPPVGALLFSTNRLAISALRYIKTIPVRVPEDLAVVGFDETDAFDFFYSPLTYIKQPLQQMGKMAIRILLDDIKAKTKTEQVVMSAELIVRQSSVKVTQ